MSSPPNRNEVIEFLVRRKFRSVLAVLSSPPNQPTANRTTTLARALGHQERDRYRSELSMLAPNQLQSLYEVECAAALEESNREESARFFNLSHAAADFEHWSKMEHWSLDEAIALAMGKAPEIVSWDKIRAFKDISPFVGQYARLRDLAERAKAWQKLFDPVLPAIFLKWAEDNEIPVPAELSERVSKLKGKLVDWKKEYDQLRSRWEQLVAVNDRLRDIYDQHTGDLKKIIKKQAETIEDQQSRIAESEAELAAIKEAHPASEPKKPQSPMERQNMLKAIYAMAINGYGYNPEDKRSKVITEIVSDISLAGFSVSDDTIRRYIKEARGNADEWQEGSSS